MCRLTITLCVCRMRGRIGLGGLGSVFGEEAQHFPELTGQTFPGLVVTIRNSSALNQHEKV